jgi:DNA-binding MarR family transcriptional regulator
MNEIHVKAVEECDAYALIQALMHAGKFTEMELDAALAVVNLSAAKWNALRHLAAAGGQLPLGQLAARLSCVKSNATQLVDRLEAEQLVCRLPDPDDRRSIRAEITAKGRRAYTAGEKVVHDFEERLLSDFPFEERLLLSRLLARLRGQTQR